MTVQIRYNSPMPILYPECEGPYVVWSKDNSGHLQSRSVETFDRAVELYLSDSLRFIAIMEVVPIHITDARKLEKTNLPSDTVTVGLDGSGTVIHAALNRFKRRAEIEQKALDWVLNGLLVKQMNISEMPRDYPRSRIEFLNE